MAPVRHDPAALLRDHFESREKRTGLEAAARIGRARLSQSMAQVPSRQANAWVPALSGLAAAAVIGGAALLHFQGAGSTALTTAPVQTAAVVSVPAPVEPAPAPMAAASRPEVIAARTADRPALSAVPQTEPAETEWVPLASNPTAEPRSQSLEVRLTKSEGGILVRWDGPASVRQFELRKSCVDFRNPGHAIESGRIRLNDGAWLDTAPDSCGTAATQYEVAELTA